MAQNTRTLPDFHRPPVVEVVLGVQFTPLRAFSIQHFGLFYRCVRDEYPKFEEQPLLLPAIEDFGHAPKSAGLEVVVGTSPEIRGWYIDQTGGRLVQIQKDRFLFNWRKAGPDEPSPRWHRVEPLFEKEWKRFRDFLEEEQLGAPEVNQCEVTYVNHIEVGQGWKRYGELHNVLAPWSGETSEAFLPEPEKVMIHAHYVMADQRGRLWIRALPAIRRQDAKDILVLELTARGKPNSSGFKDVVEWFELGHEWIVRGFTAFTSRHMHNIWERNL